MKRILIALSLFAMIGALSVSGAFAQSRSEAARLFNKAYKLNQSTKSNEDAMRAIVLYEKAIDICLRHGDRKNAAIAYSNIGRIYDYRLGQNNKAWEYHEKAMSMSRSTRDLRLEAQILSNAIHARGKTLKEGDLIQILSGMYHIQEANRLLHVARRLGDRKLQLQAHQKLGSDLKRSGSTDKALEHYRRASAIAKDIGNKSVEMDCLTSIAEIYEQIKDVPNAMEYHRRRLKLAKKTGDAQSQKRALYFLQEAYENQGDWENALACLEQALAIDRRRRDKKGEAGTLGELASFFRFSKDDYKKALEYYRKQLDLLKVVGGPKDQAYTLDNIGDVLIWDKQYDSAESHFRECLGIWKRIKDTREEGKALARIGDTHRYRSNYGKAEDYYRQAIEVFRQKDHPHEHEEALRDLGYVLRRQSKYSQALESYGKALKITAERKWEYQQAKALDGLGDVYKDQGDYGKAVESYEKARTLAIKNGYKSLQTNVLISLALMSKDTGQYAKALEHYEKALAIARDEKDIDDQQTILNNLGVTCEAMGDHARAITYFKQSVEICRKKDDKREEGRSLTNLGRVQAQVGETDKARASFERAVSLFKDAGKPTRFPANELAHLLMDEGDMERAEKLVKSEGYNDAEGRLALLQNKYSEAESYYRRILRRAKKDGDVDDLFTAYTGLGKSYEGLGDYAKAEDYYRKGMDLTEDLRSSLLPAERKNFLAVKINGFTREEPAKGLTRIRLKHRHGTEGIESAEAARARAFSDRIATGPGGAASPVPAEVMKEEARLVTKLAVLKKNRSRISTEDAPATYRKLTDEISEAEKELNQFIELLREQHPIYAAVKYPRPVDLSSSALEPNEQVVMFDVSQQGVGIKLIANKKIIRTFYIDWPEEELENAISKFREPLESMSLNKFHADLGNELYRKLLAPILIGVDPGEPLIVVPDGVLGMLPFESLVVSGKLEWKNEGGRSIPTGLQYLGDVHPISYYQSITALTLTRETSKNRKRGNRTLVLADPVFSLDDKRAASIQAKSRGELLAGLPSRLMSYFKDAGTTGFDRLPLTAKLAKALKHLEPKDTDVFEGLDATKSRLFGGSLAQYRNIVFATHGYFGNDIPEIHEPVLVLSLVDEPNGRDGFLRMSEVMGLKLNADVVALTACQTGLGRSQAGEGVMSMGRAFQAAGAESVLMSLWSVSEKASVKLVERYFTHLKDGKSKLEALTLARADIRKQGLEHPFYWASFILVGEVK